MADAQWDEQARTPWNDSGVHGQPRGERLRAPLRPGATSTAVRRQAASGGAPTPTPLYVPPLVVGTVPEDKFLSLEVRAARSAAALCANCRATRRGRPNTRATDVFTRAVLRHRRSTSASSASCRPATRTTSCARVRVPASHALGHSTRPCASHRGSGADAALFTRSFCARATQPGGAPGAVGGRRQARGAAELRRRARAAGRREAV
jgi:hypothetical protein